MAENSVSTLKQLRMLALREKAYTTGKIAELSEVALKAINEIKESQSQTGVSREVLAANLTAMGVPASPSETLEALIAKVLRIRQGDLSVILFDAVLTGPQPSYGYFSLSEVYPMAGALAVERLNLIEQATLTVVSEDGVMPEITAPGWTRGELADRTVTLTYAPEDYMTRFDLMDAVNRITMTSGVECRVSIKLTAYDEGRTEYPASGEASIRWQSMSWDAFEGFGWTWAQLEAAGVTWEQIQVMGKPET